MGKIKRDTLLNNTYLSNALKEAHAYEVAGKYGGRTLDTRGTMCPLPVLRTKQAMHSMQSGEMN